jgi:hypothetical protein
MVVAAKFVEREIDGRGDAVGRDRPDRRPFALLQADLLRAEGDVGIGSHVKVPRRSDVGVSPGIARIEACGVQDGVHVADEGSVMLKSASRNWTVPVTAPRPNRCRVENRTVVRTGSMR